MPLTECVFVFWMPYTCWLLWDMLRGQALLSDSIDVLISDKRLSLWQPATIRNVNANMSGGNFMIFFTQRLGQRILVPNPLTPLACDFNLPLTVLLFRERNQNTLHSMVG